MIVVKLEMWPLGNEARAYELGRTYIRNVGTNLDHPKKGNYEVKVCRKGKTEFKGWRQIKATRTGQVDNWPRLTRNVWRLILRCLMSAFPEEKS